MEFLTAQLVLGQEEGHFFMSRVTEVVMWKGWEVDMILAMPDASVWIHWKVSGC